MAIAEEEDPAADKVEFDRMKELVDVPMLESERGRAMLSLVASCALPAEEAAFGDLGGKRFVFPGDLGLVPDWPERPLTPSDQRWISACVLARRNGGSDAGVKLSLRTAHAAMPPFTPDDAERKRFTIHEGGFFGNLFLPQPLAFTCRGDRSEEEDRDPVMRKRICTTLGNDGAMTALGLTACGYRMVGFCSQIGTPVLGGETYREFIEVYLEPEAP